MLQNGVHRDDVPAGPGPGAVLAAVARREVDRGPVGEVHAEPGDVDAAAARARSPGAVAALGERAERNGGGLTTSALGGDKRNGGGRLTTSALGGDTGGGCHGRLLSARG